MRIEFSSPRPFSPLVGVWLCLILVLAAGCAVNYGRTMRPVTRDLVGSGPDSALEELREVFPDSTGRDRLLYLMEAGNLLRLSGDYAAAENMLLEADRLSDQQRGMELGQEAEAFLTSDLALEFRGADYEKVFINYCLAACYASEGNMEDALVECRRVNDKLRAINLAYEDDRNRYDDDAFIRYLMGLMFEKAGDLNNALVAYRNSAEVYQGAYRTDYGIPVPEDVKRSILRISHRLGMSSIHQDYSSMWPETDWRSSGSDSSHGEVVVILEAGLLPPREETAYTFATDDRIFHISLPGLPDTGEQPLRVILRSGEYSAEGFLVEDVAAIARKNLEDHAGRDIARAVARLAVKAGVAEAGEQIVEELTSENSTVSTVTGLILSIFGAATENADLRAWMTLPSRIYAVRLPLPAGERLIGLSVNGMDVLSGIEVTLDPWETELLFVSESGL